MESRNTLPNSSSYSSFFHPLILAIGLNPSFQKILQFTKFSEGEVNRANSVTLSNGGKGQNFARAANFLYPGSVLVAQFLGGDTGKFIEENLKKQKIPFVTVPVKVPTRTCTTILCEETKRMTELIEPSNYISNEESSTLFKQIVDFLMKHENSNSSNLKGVALCGTYPSGITPQFFAQIALLKNKVNPSFKILLDAFQGISDTLETGLIDVLKINSIELKTISNCGSIVEGATLMMKKHNIPIVLITCGPDAAHSFHKKEDGQIFHSEYQIPLLSFNKVVNPIGAGDTCSAIFMLEWLQGKEIEEAFARGLAAASASVLKLEAAEFAKEDYEEIYPQIKIIQDPKPIL